MKLLVRARGSASVPDLVAAEGGLKRFVGRRVDLAYGPDQVCALIPTGENHEVPSLFEYKRAVQDEELWAANAETAAFCGVPFDPKFGVSDAEEASE